MKTQLLRIVQEEDPKNPLTDEEIAAKLGIRRDKCTLLRQQFHIPDSRKRRLPLLTAEMNRILKEHSQISDRKLTGELRKIGFEISKFTVMNLRKEQQENWLEMSLATETLVSQNKEQSAQRRLRQFADLIESDGFLLPFVQQVKAVILYPYQKLPILFQGEKGTGKRAIAEAAFSFAKQEKQLTSEAIFIEIDIREIPEGQLFEQRIHDTLCSYKGVGGALYIREIQLLSLKSIEGVLKRVREMDSPIFVFASSTNTAGWDNPDFMHRLFPIQIHLPTLASWPRESQLRFLEDMIQQQAQQAGCPIRMDKCGESKKLMNGYTANITQLRAEICAFVCNELIDWLFETISTPQSDERTKQSSPTAVAPDSIYHWLHIRFAQMNQQGVQPELIRLQLQHECRERLRDDSGKRKSDAERARSLSIFVGEKVMQMVEQMLWIAERHLVLDHEKLLMALALHVKGMLERYQVTEPNQVYHGDRKSEATTTYLSMEWIVAEEMAEVIKSTWGISITKAETEMLARYVKHCTLIEKNSPTVGMVLVSYGSIAESMAEQLHSLFGQHHIQAVSLSVDDSEERFLSKVSSAIKRADHGMGVVVLADAGRMVGSEEIWREHVQVETLIFAPLSLPFAMEVMRRCLYAPKSLSHVAQEIVQWRMPVSPFLDEWKIAKPKALMLVCLTGEGAARQLGQIVSEHVGDRGGDLHYLFANTHTVRSSYTKWKEEYHILAVVGTIDPLVEGLPFISLQNLIEGSGFSFLDRLLMVGDWTGGQADIDQRTSLHMQDLFVTDLIFSDCNISNKQEAILFLAHKLVEKGYVKPEFVQKVWEREKLGATSLAGGIAIPHAEPAQTIKPAVAIMQLAHPLEWGPGIQVDWVIMLAVNDTCQFAVEELMEALEEPANIQKITTRGGEEEKWNQ
ncbi:PTS sugar transporter subunit IIA [Brevibacillus laterosporus]|uniref:PTS sugar transporter subunit IIA n=1 Tax=Brevibacillus laterosporus TaxID=1465 RepID=UPI000CE4B065|nr:PTS sugar transporter subunit IIA [Brevibacillus laterosporus]MED1666321.1 PTS sugar transporter subunit IIA [Brevibacillus laterosporus]MED1670644.1 PTS sugar transporter subunit IIA [Brevibacillus laterosporus]MED1716649.1 PTS sugar transporter subunit IIA [Brevibacillus laterosporus]PPA89449.1 transcriptional regulator [Brevibacillus laterosporus]